LLDPYKKIPPRWLHSRALLNHRIFSSAVRASAIVGVRHRIDKGVDSGALARRAITARPPKASRGPILTQINGWIVASFAFFRV
jgi:hypothetical protein